MRSKFMGTLEVRVKVELVGLILTRFQPGEQRTII